MGRGHAEDRWRKRVQREVGSCPYLYLESEKAERRRRSSLVERVKALSHFPSESEASRIISGLRWIGLFSSEKVKVRSGNLLDTLCARLETLMKYEQGERDLVMLQHKFHVEWQDGREVRPKSLGSLWRG